MPLGLKEITEREEALRQEIAEREHMLVAYQSIRADREKALGLHRPVLAAPSSVPLPAQPSDAPATSDVSAPIMPQGNLHLQRLRAGHGGPGRAVRWILRQMTEDFTVHDLAAVLRAEGCPIAIEKLSLVLNRMKCDREITEIRRGGGRRPSVFRGPASTAVPPAEPSSAQDATCSALASPPVFTA